MDVPTPETPTPVKHPMALPLRWASVVAVPFLGFVCYAAPYVTGLIYRGKQLDGLNVPAGLFKSDASDYFIYAYLAVIETFSNWTSFLTNPMLWAGMVAVFAILLLEVLLLPKLFESSAAQSIGKAVGKYRSVAIPTAVLTFSLMVTIVLLLIPLILSPLLILPAIIGQYSAKETLTRNLAFYAKGCEHVSADEDRCYAVMDGPRLVAAGFLVASSDQHLALYRDHKSVIVPIKDYTITTLSPDDYRALTAPPAGISKAQ